MAKVEIYTKAYCPFCTHALALLKSKSVDYTEIKIDGDMTMRSAMIERSNGSYTVPQIFINDAFSPLKGNDTLLSSAYTIVI